ncbi:MAG TPA: 16S rRNA (cytosine(1402)-N(4))-methyltransferase RsmH [Candidatus Paceibacterota bacterium]|nr:16S rRNA (cytosine(1402)-N(4))-methyltransferase RsmH [Candidatus Paceibacterota bacterium]
MRTRRSESSSGPVSAETEHQSVLLDETIEALDLKKGLTAVDATLGGAGHAAAIAARLGATGTLVGFDADRAAIARATERLQKAAPRVILEHRNFRQLGAALDALGIAFADRFLFDLGWSSYQLAAGRGFSFQSDDPLVMTYADAPGEDAITAGEIVNEWSEASLADVLYGWGGERYARRIAKAIVAARQEKPIETARQLALVVDGAVPAAYRRGRTNPATKTFQAIRIAANDELGALTEALDASRSHLAHGGRIAVITFHSLEDRLVKQAFRAWERGGAGVLGSKKPIGPSEKERAENPRARSAKLRVFIKN